MKTHFLYNKKIRKNAGELVGYCAVCDAYVGRLWDILSSSRMRFGDKDLIIPEYHEQCRELFFINPLPYEEICNNEDTSCL